MKSHLRSGEQTQRDTESLGRGALIGDLGLPQKEEPMDAEAYEPLIMNPTDSRAGSGPTGSFG